MSAREEQRAAAKFPRAVHGQGRRDSAEGRGTRALQLAPTPFIAMLSSCGQPVPRSFPPSSQMRDGVTNWGLLKAS